jgi:hypothetical protein
MKLMISGCHTLCGADEVTFIFAILIIDDDDNLSRVYIRDG